MLLFRDEKPPLEAVFEHRPAGHIIVNGTEVARTLQCCHCGEHWICVRGSGAVRGYCTRCNNVTCGRAACDPCVPLEARLDYQEGTRVAGGYLDATRDLFATEGPWR